MGMRMSAAAAAMLCASQANAAVVSVDGPELTISPDYSIAPAFTFDPVEVRIRDKLVINFKITNTAAKYAHVYYTLPFVQPPFVGVSTWVNRLGLAEVGENTFSTTFIFFKMIYDLPEPEPFYVGEIYLRANAAPEPSTWAMLLLGFAGVAALRSRRQRRPVKHVDVAAAPAVSD